MLTNVFLKICGLSLTAGVITLAVLLLRLCFKKAPRWLIAAAWGLVALRLLLPFTIHSPISLLQGADTVTTEQVTVPVVDPKGEVDIYIYPTPVVHSGFEALDERVNPILREQFALEIEEGKTPTEAPLDRFLRIAAVIWLCGAAGMLLYAAGSHYLLARKLAESLPYENDKRVRRSDRISSPFILGIFRPVIYLPADIDPETADSVIAHEHTHLRRGDHLLKPLGFLLLGVYWFNPLLWLAYAMFCRDIEFACDEKVVADLAEEERLRYAKALLACGIGSGSVLRRRYVTACPLAFGEVSIKERVKKVLNFKKPAFWIILVAAVALIVAGALLLTSPLREKEPEPTSETSETSSGESSSGETDPDAEYAIGEEGYFGNFTVPEGTAALAPYAFRGCTISRLTLPDSLRTIHSTSFEGMTMGAVSYRGTTYEIDPDNVWLSDQSRMITTLLTYHPELEVAYDELVNPEWKPRYSGSVEADNSPLLYAGGNCFTYHCLSFTVNKKTHGVSYMDGVNLSDIDLLSDCGRFFCRRTRVADGVYSAVYRNGFTYFKVNVAQCFGGRNEAVFVVAPEGTVYTDFIDGLYELVKKSIPETFYAYELRLHYDDRTEKRTVYAGETLDDAAPDPEGKVFVGWTYRTFENDEELGYFHPPVVLPGEELQTKYLDIAGQYPDRQPLDLYPVYVPAKVTVVFDGMDFEPREMDFPLSNSILGEQIMPKLDGPGMYEDENGDLLPLYDPKEEILKEVEGWYFTGLTEVMGEHGVEYNQITWFCPMGSPLPYCREFIQLIRTQGSTLHVTPLYRTCD